MRIELHCHLDGSLNIDFVQEMLRDQGIVYEREELEEKLVVRPDCTSLTEYLEKFDLPLRCLQTKESLRRAAYELVRDVSKEGVRYIEVRFAPMLSTENGLNCEEVIESVVDGLQEGEGEFGVYASAIVCAMRNHSLEQNMEMLKAARKFIGKGVCALDLAGDESAFPTSLFRDLFIQAKEWGIPFTIHSGECGSVDNIREAIELGAKRLGHGIALEKSLELRKLCREKGIGIEMCPTSNFQTKAVEDLATYPLKQFLEEGLLVSIHTDNRTVSGTTLTNEEVVVREQLQLPQEVMKQCTANAIQTAFASDEIKNQLMEEFRMEQKLARALEIIEELDWETVECGRYDVDDELYYMVQEYETKYPEQARYEAHEKYVDIQYIVKGIERMEFAETSKLKVTESYNPEKDVKFLEEPKVIDASIVEEGDYRIFYPEDAHRPGLCVNNTPAKVKKILAKILI